MAKNLMKLLLTTLIISCSVACLACTPIDESSSSSSSVIENPNEITITTNPVDIVLTSNDSIDLTASLSQVVYEYTGEGTVSVELSRVEKDGAALSIADYAHASLLDEGEYTVYFVATDGTSSAEGSYSVTMPTKNIGNFDADDALAGWENVDVLNMLNAPYGWTDSKDGYVDGGYFTSRFQTGQYFIDTHENIPESDSITFKSPEFTVFEDSFVSFKIAGAGNENVWVALIDVESGETLQKFYNYNFKDRNVALTFVRYFYPVSEYAGKTLRLDFVDNSPGGFGFISVNDVWVNLSADEAKAKLAEDKERVMSYQLNGAVNDPDNAAGFIADVQKVYSETEIIPVLKGVSNYSIRKASTENFIEKLAEIETYNSEVYPVTTQIISVTKGEVVDTTSDFTQYSITEAGEYVVSYSITGANGFYVERTFTVSANITAVSPELVNGSFEDGLNGWHVEGSFDNIRNTDTTYWDWGALFLKDGNYHLSTRDPEGNTGYIYSDPFMVDANTFISFQLGACGSNRGNYVALVDVENDEELVRYYNTAFAGPAEITLFHYVYDVSALAGKAVYFKIVDSTTRDWGVIVADNFKVNLTYAQAQSEIADAKEKVSAAVSTLDLNDDRRKNHKAYVEEYYNALSISPSVLLTGIDTELTNGSFENGMEGWHVVGSFDNIRNTDTTYWDWGALFLKDGTYHLSTRDPEGNTGYIYSDAFKVEEDTFIMFQLGACGSNEGNYVALIDAETGEELVRYRNTAFAGPAEITLFDYIYDVSDYAGKSVYFKIVDSTVRDWGVIVADNFRVNLTLEEAKAEVASVKEKITAALSTLDLNDDRRVSHKAYVEAYYAALKVPVIEITTELKNGSFEDGMDGWHVEGSFNNIRNTDTTYWDWGALFLKDGDYHLSTRDPEGNTGYIYSDPFMVEDNTYISFQLGACGKSDGNYVALIDYETGAELVRYKNTAFDGPAEITLFHYFYDVSAFAGKTVYFKIVDSTTSDWGVLVADNFKVNLTADEARAEIASAKEKITAALSTLDLNDDRRVTHKAYVEAYYDALTI